MSSLSQPVSWSSEEAWFRWGRRAKQRGSLVPPPTPCAQSESLLPVIHLQMLCHSWLKILRHCRKLGRKLFFPNKTIQHSDTHGHDSETNAGTEDLLFVSVSPLHTGPAGLSPGHRRPDLAPPPREKVGDGYYLQPSVPLLPFIWTQLSHCPVLLSGASVPGQWVFRK